jgi:hypothetical protein
MNQDLHQAISVMPDGRIYAGVHDDSNGYPRSGLLGSYRKDKKTGLIAKTIPHDRKIASLTARIADNPEFALNAATTIADQSNISHLQLIRLFPELQGQPTDYFFLDELFVERDVPQIQLRETFYDTTASAEYKGRLEESKATKTNFDEIAYNLSKLVDKVYTPIEDIMKTIINPQIVDLEQIRYGFKWKRNQSAATALAAIGNAQSAIGDPAVIAAGAFHSTHNTANDLNALFATFLAANDVAITHVAMNLALFQTFTSNTWTKGGPDRIEPMRLAYGGVAPMPGLPGITAVIDQAVPANTFYCVNKPNALRLGEGPKIMRRYYDEEKDAEAIKVLDFHQYIAVNSQLSKIQRKFGMIIPITPGS